MKRTVVSSLFFFLGLMLLLNYSSINAQIPKGGIVNSKYLTITEQGFRSGNYSNQITGTLFNNSTQEISSNVYVGLYDAKNQLITMDIGYPDITPLPANEYSTFSISLYELNDETIDHYILYPGGLP